MRKCSKTHEEMDKNKDGQREMNIKTKMDT